MWGLSRIAAGYATPWNGSVSMGKYISQSTEDQPVSSHVMMLVPSALVNLCVSGEWIEEVVCELKICVISVVVVECGVRV